MSKSVLVLALLICLSALSAAWADDDTCPLKRVAQLETRITDDRLQIKVQVNDQDLWMEVSPATPISLISSRMADRLKLSLRDITGAVVIGSNGRHVQNYTRAKTLTLSGMTANNVQFLVMPPPTAAPGSKAEEEFQGGLGAEFLSRFDVDFDLPHGKIALFSKSHCPGRVAYWTSDYVAIPFKLDNNNHIWFPTQLDGHEFRTLFDTSSEYTSLSTQAARSVFDLDPAGAGLPPDGVEERGMPYHLHRFDAFDIGGIAFHNTEFRIIPDKQHREIQNFAGIVDAPLKLGLHHLAKLHVYVAYDEKVLYVSAPNAQ